MKKAIKWFLENAVPFLSIEGMEELIEFLQKKLDKMKAKRDSKSNGI